MPDTDERWGVAANFAGDKVYKPGARVYVLCVDGSLESARVSGRSRGGRIVEKWVRFKRLAKFRARMMPPGSEIAVWGMEGKSHAIGYAGQLSRNLAMVLAEDHTKKETHARPLATLQSTRA